MQLVEEPHQHILTVKCVYDFNFFLLNLSMERVKLNKEKCNY